MKTVDQEVVYLTDRDKKRLLARVRRLKGQVEAIERKLAEGECADTLIQLTLAVRGAAGQLAAEMATLHLADCVQSCMVKRVPDPETRIQRLVQVIRQLVRNT